MNFKHSKDILYKKPLLNDFYKEYNALFASVLAENINNFAYITSPIINRLEAQTHLYEKIEKYIQIQDLLNNDQESGVIIADEDELLYEILKKEFGIRIKRENKKNIGVIALIKRSLQRVSILRFAVRMLRFGGRTLRLILATRRFRPNQGEHSSIIRTYFDFRCADQKGKLREEYFGPFAVDLAKQEKLLVVYKLLHVEDLDLYLRLRKNDPSFNSCLIESFLDPYLLVKAMMRFSRSKIRLNRMYYKNRDITQLLQRAIDAAFYTLLGVEVFLEYEVAQKILKLNPKRIYFPYENQTWEKVYPLVKKEGGFKSTKITGFQHTGLSYKLIMYFPAEIEKHLPLYPDQIITVGSIYQRLLREKAYYPCELKVGAALRHSKYVVNGGFNFKLSHKKLQKRIVYAFSYDLSKYKDILETLIDVFKESGIIVYLKIHPDYKEEYVLKELGIKLPKNMLLAQKISWEEIYGNVDCVLYDDNSIGVEGLINGVKTYMLDVGEPIYECNRMFYFDQWEASINKEGLLKLRNEIEQECFDPSFNEEKIKEYVNAYYRAYKKEEHFEVYL